MRVPVVIHLIGIILRMFGAAFAAPLGVALWYGEKRDAVYFLLAGVVTAIVGHAMTRAHRRTGDDLKRVEGLAIVAGSWLLVAFSAANPYVCAGMGPIDAVFDGNLGLAEVAAGLRSILFERAVGEGGRMEAKVPRADGVQDLAFSVRRVKPEAGQLAHMVLSVDNVTTG